MVLAKRLIDILLSLIGLIILIPFLPLIGLFIKFDSSGPVFYLADRVGKDMKNFKMFKFRTMIDTPIEVGESVSPQYDPRVTNLGRFLRRMKINELPQLINILKGEMTFVGPRPEAPELAELYPEEAKKIFSFKPGLVGPATILGRNEEEIYPPGLDSKKYYIENILPNKNKIDLEYIENISLFKDIKYILMGVKETLVGAISKRHIHDNRSQIYLLLSDLFLIVCSYIFANIVYFWGLSAETGWTLSFLTLSVVIITRLAWNIYFGLYSSLIRYISYHDVVGVFKGVTAGSLFLALIAHLLGWINYPSVIAIIDWIYLIIFLSGLRFFLRLYWDTSHRDYDERRKHRILIYGVCDEGNAACRALTSEKYWPFEIVGFIDDAQGKYGKVINGKKVLGNRNHIKALAQLYRVEEILVADPGIHPDTLSEIMAICEEADLKCRIWNFMHDIDSVGPNIFRARNIDSSDILPLRRIHANHDEVRRILINKTVLMNGSGGALGLELCRRILQLGCSRVIILDRYECYLNELIAALLRDFSQEEIVPVLTEGEEIGYLEEVFRKYRPDIVIHAGMRKYTPPLGVDLGDIGRANYLRTFNLARVASKFQCELFVMISSLMAGNGENFITDSLRIAEVSLGHYFSDSNTRLTITRICDIVENQGGIVSIIENQIRNQETVILPTADAQTYLISKYSAAEFILQSLVEANKKPFDRRIFSCDAGLPIPLIEVTKKIADLYGMKPGSDLSVKYTGKSREAISMSPSKTVPSSSIYSSDIKTAKEPPGFTNDGIKSQFKEFVLSENNQSASQDWKARTRELLELCKAGPLLQRGGLSSGMSQATESGIQPAN